MADCLYFVTIGFCMAVPGIKLPGVQDAVF